MLTWKRGPALRDGQQQTCARMPPVVTPHPTPPRRTCARVCAAVASAVWAYACAGVWRAAGAGAAGVRGHAEAAGRLAGGCVRRVQSREVHQGEGGGRGMEGEREGFEGPGQAMWVRMGRGGGGGVGGVCKGRGGGGRQGATQEGRRGAMHEGRRGATHEGRRGATQEGQAWAHVPPQKGGAGAHVANPGLAGAA